MDSLLLFRISLGFFVLISTVSSRNLKCFSYSTQNNDVDVVHVASDGEKDTIHYVWSGYKLPSIIVARTSKDNILSIDVTKLSNFDKDAITFKNGKLMDSVGLTFNKLWGLNYAKDTDDITEVDSVEDLDLKSFSWFNITISLSCSDNFASTVLRVRSNESLFSENGIFEIQFSVSADEEISNAYPHLVFTGNSTLLKLVLDNLQLNNSKARFGFEISVFSAFLQECKQENWQIIKTKSINDEYSPGVFSDVEFLAPCEIKDKQSSFVSWRPVAYTGNKPIVANSSDVNIVNDPTVIRQQSISSVAELYFSEKSNPSVFNVTFGTKGDGFYSATFYTEWSLMLGTGRMIEIPLSTSVIIFATTGLGITLLFMVAGGVYLLYKRCKKKDDDELLLN